MLNKIGALARYVILAIVTAFVPLGMMNVPLVLGLIAGLALLRENIVLASVIAIVLPIVGAALGHIPTVGAHFGAVTANLQVGVAGALATAIAILLYGLVTNGLMALTGSASAGTPAAAAS